MNTALAPTIAQTYKAAQKDEFQSIVTRASYVTAASSIALSATIYVLGPDILSFFGAEFLLCANALWILLTGHVANACAGSVGLILKMTGHERDVAWIGFLSAAPNIGLNGILIPKYGINGAAVATALTMSAWPILAGAIVYKRTGINPSVFQKFQTSVQTITFMITRQI